MKTRKTKADLNTRTLAAAVKDFRTQAKRLALKPALVIGPARSAVAAEAVQPYCQECGRPIVRPASFGPAFYSRVLLDAWVRVACPCGWEGWGKWFRSQG